MSGVTYRMAGGFQKLASANHVWNGTGLAMKIIAGTPATIANTPFSGETIMNATLEPKKSVDLPPYGKRNADPVSNTPGSHPIKTGIGAIVGGAASGLAVGAVAGPVGAVVGAMIGGAAAGGLAGKGIGELIDPTTEDNWIREYLKDHPKLNDRAADFTHAYRFGLAARQRYAGQQFHAVADDLETDWYADPKRNGLAWGEAQYAIRGGFERTIEM
jgi:hypothetical protein